MCPKVMKFFDFVNVDVPSQVLPFSIVNHHRNVVMKEGAFSAVAPILFTSQNANSIKKLLLYKKLREEDH